jgi:hypothetical protein
MRTSSTGPSPARRLLLALLVIFSLVSTASAVQPPRRSSALRRLDLSVARGFGSSEDLDASAPHGCEKHETKEECHAPCLWCASAAVPSACYGAKEAAKLPPGVFMCDTR